MKLFGKGKDQEQEQEAPPPASAETGGDGQAGDGEINTPEELAAAQLIIQWMREGKQDPKGFARDLREIAEILEQASEDRAPGIEGVIGTLTDALNGVTQRLDALEKRNAPIKDAEVEEPKPAPSPEQQRAKVFSPRSGGGAEDGKARRLRDY